MKLEVRRNLSQIAGTALIGLCAGLVAVFFHIAMERVFDYLIWTPSTENPWWFGYTTIFLMVSGAALTGVLISRFAPDAPGSGIPQVKAAYHSGRLDFSWNLIWVKFLGGVLSIGTGSSLGREGPTIHIGAAVASKVANLLGEDKAAKANAVCAGSAAGLSAAFNSPLAGVTLVLEEIAGGKNQHKFAGRSLLAAALAASVVFFLSHDQASLPIGKDLLISWKVMALSPVVAVFAGFCGLAFQYFTLGLRNRMKHIKLPMPFKLALGAFFAGLVALLCFRLVGYVGVFALGEVTLQKALNHEVIWQAALVLLVGKLIATSLCYGTGGCGGIFAPMVFFGAMAGLVVAGVATPFMHLTPDDQVLLALVGITGTLAAVVRAPITSILIVMEMTWQIHVLPALMIAAVIAVFLNRTCFQANFYDAALQQDGIKIPD
ncbi:MAG: chloride channel protein [Verrucomicrobia bacterium]|nr:chloride channel protein [Verrucomicrobiota bacterium]